MKTRMLGPLLLNIETPSSPVVKVETAENHPFVSYQAFTARLKPCPFKT